MLMNFHVSILEGEKGKEKERNGEGRVMEGEKWKAAEEWEGG
jgi:hypothetical protein